MPHTSNWLRIMSLERLDRVLKLLEIPLWVTVTVHFIYYFFHNEYYCTPNVFLKYNNVEFHCHSLSVLLSPNPQTPLLASCLLSELLAATPSPVVFCHNDVQEGKILSRPIRRCAHRHAANLGWSLIRPLLASLTHFLELSFLYMCRAYSGKGTKRNQSITIDLP